jgi:hypothetical protein
MEHRDGLGGASSDSPHVEAAFGASPRVPWWASRRIRLPVLLALLGAAVFALLGVRGYWFNLGGGLTQASGAAFAPGCPGREAPEVQSVPVRALSELHNAVSRIMPPLVGRVYEMGTITTSNLWSDNRPSPPSSTRSPAELVPAGYEMRWWALDRDGSQDDVVADVFEFATEKQAYDALTRAASPHCRRYGVGSAAPFLAGASNLVWVNPDDVQEWDVLFVRAHRLYRVADAPPGYLPGERRGAQMTVDVLACALPDADCPTSTPSAHQTNLATLTAATGAGSGLRLSGTQATAYAHAVNLRAYDVPELRQVAPEGPTRDRGYWEAFARCNGEPRSMRAVAAIHSPIFGYGGRARYELVYSTVAVLPSEAAADRYVATLASAHARHCIAHAYDLVLLGRTATERSRLNLGALTLKALPATAPSTYRSVGPYRGIAQRLTLQLSFTTRRGRHVRVPLYVEGAAFAHGPAVIGLTATTSFRRFPDASEQYLISALVGRAEASGD